MDILNLACQEYERNLINNQTILQYIYNRGINLSTIKKHRIGYCSDNVGYKKLNKIFSDELLLESNIFRRRETGEMVDLFNGRITLPILINNIPEYFTSRLYPEISDRPKHLHQTGQISHAINFDVLDKAENIILVEGPFDCYTLDQNGLPSLGLLGANRISHEIIAKLYNKIVYICFDSDPNKTGDKASKKLARKLASFDIKSRIISFEDNGEKQDINSFFLTKNKKEFQELIKKAVLYNKKENKRPATYKYRSSLPIVKIASKYLDIKYIGGRYKTICPFHHEGDPSLIFYEETNTFFCFGCGQYGNAVTLVQKLEELRGNKITKREAYEMIKDIG